MAFLIDSEGVPPGRRASHFRDAMMGSPLPVNDASNSRFEAHDFRARFHFRPFSDAFLADVLATGLRLTRSRREIKRNPCRQVLIALLSHGRCREDFEEGLVLVQEPGDLMVLDLDAPQTATIDIVSSATVAYIPRRYEERPSLVY
jgi:hypothetical protein